ncbi:MAG: methyltransferase domain-containing protein [Streptosporangiales bacterium]|nr:methyltransferase domain-containing protein [Streptosporangiales bacterium]MBO0890271.1 methyltransferase domain-containing protein [Acidothermales bacterium]
MSELDASAEGHGAFLAATGRDPEDSGDAQRRYRRYQHDLIRPHCGTTVVEVGAGAGEFAATFTGPERYVVTDLDPDCVRLLGERFADRPEITARQMDASGTVALDEPADTVLAVNVLEHIEDDAAALRALARMVRPGGTVVMWVPGYQALYGEFDRSVGHHRRYTPGTLTEAFTAAGLRPTTVRPVNLLGGIAWWLAVRKGGVGRPDPRLVRWYDRLVVPVTRTIETLVTPPFGQSVLGVAVVPGPDPSR